MEILFITHKYPPSIGGMENQSFHLIENISKHCKTHKIVYEGQGSVFKFYWQLKSRIKAILKKHPSIDVIHCNDGTIGVLCSWLKSYTDIKICVTLHGLDVVFPSVIFQKILLGRLKKFDRIITVSQATKDECLKRGFASHKVVTISNGVDHSISDSDSDPMIFERLLKDKVSDIGQKKIIVSLGRAVPRKGFSWFIKNVISDLPSNYLYVMIGPFDQQATLRERMFALFPKVITRKLALLFGWPTDQREIRTLMKRKAFNNQVFHLGKLPYSQMLSCLSESDLFVMPNLGIDGDLEGFGLVALEACLRGTTVLASNIEGIKDAIHNNKNGIMIQSKNIEAWINKITSHINENSFDNKKAIQYTKEHFSWALMSKEYYQEFSNLIHKKSKNESFGESLFLGLPKIAF